MKPLTRIVVLALLLVSSRAIAQQAPKTDDSDRTGELESRLDSCDQTLRDIAVTKRAIDASGPSGVSQADDARAHRLIGIARRTTVETSTRADLQNSATLKEILIFVPKLIDALTRQNPAESPGRLLADGTTRVATVVDSAGLEAATHALNIAVDGLELAASSPRDAHPDDGQTGWKTSDAGKELAEMMKGAADCMLLTGRNATLEQVIQSGLAILGETHSFDSNLIRAVTSYTQQPGLSADQREQAVSELSLMQEADERLDNLHQSVQKELQEPAPAQVRTAVTTADQPVQQAVEPSPSSEVEPPPSAEPGLPEATTPNPNEKASAAQPDEAAPDSTSPENQATPSEQPSSDDTSSAETSSSQEETTSSSDDRTDADAPPPDDQVEASPADVEADQKDVQPDQNDGDQPSADAPPDTDSNPPEAEPDRQGSDPSDEPPPAVEPQNLPPPPDADAPQEEVEPSPPPSTPPPAPPPTR